MQKELYPSRRRHGVRAGRARPSLQAENAQFAKRLFTPPTRGARRAQPARRTDKPSPAIAKGPSTARPARLDRLQVVVDVALGLILLQAVVLLQTADEHVLLAGDVLEVVVGELGPLRTQLAFGFFPLPLDLIPVHGSHLLVETSRTTRARALGEMRGACHRRRFRNINEAPNERRCAVTCRPTRRKRKPMAQAFRAASVKKNVAPSPGLPCAQTRPPWRSTTRATIAAPMPDPANSSARCSRWKGRKIFSASSWSNPTPLSRTAKQGSPSAESALASSTRGSGRPRVNFHAFCSRLKSIVRTSARSPRAASDAEQTNS